MTYIYCSVCKEPTPEKLDFCDRCGSVLIEIKEEDLLLPYTILQDRFKITALLKSGGMARVYKAQDANLNTTCAIKELILADLEEDKEYLILRFKSEAEILATLRHTNLPYVIDYFTNNGKYYLVMDYIKGKDLETLLQEKGGQGIELEKVIEWGIQICEVLEYLHGQKQPVVFRDVKPSNIMVREADEQIVLVDFGLAARVIEHGHNSSHPSIGTVGYAPPEQYEGTHDPRSDIYSLGATLHHLITGISPLVPFKFQSVKKLKPDIPNKLDSIITKAVTKDITRRYQSINQVKKDLLALNENIKTAKSSLVNKIKDKTSQLSKKFKDSIGLSEKEADAVSTRIKVFLVDDEEPCRNLFRNLIELNKDMELVGEAVNGEDALEKLTAHMPFPEVILMDIMMPEMDGIETTKKLLEVNPEANIVMLTVLGDKKSVLESFRAGAKGYMIKYKVDEVIEAIREAAQGETPIESSVAGFLLQELGKSRRKSDDSAQVISER